MKHTTETVETVLKLLQDGFTIAETAVETGVNPSTVKTWKARYLNLETETVETDGETVTDEVQVMKRRTVTKRNRETGIETVAATVETVRREKFDWGDLCLVLAVVALCAASVLSVADVLAQAFPLFYAAYLLAAVVCTAPLLLLLAKRVENWLAYATIGIAYVVEITANAVAIRGHAGQSFVQTVWQTTGLQAFGLAWLIGIALPTLAVCFEILLLKKFQNRD